MDLSGISAIDGHAHPLLRGEAAARLPYPAFFTEGTSARDAASSVFYLRSRREIAEFLGCEEDGIDAARDALGLEAYARRFLDAALLERVLLDDGYPRDGALTLSEMAALVPVRRVLRLEQVAEEILEERPTIEQFEETLRGRLESAEAAAFKSIAAYRCGLRLRPARHAELRVQGDEAPVRLVDRATIELMLWHALDVAGRRGLPIQFHCGFGDADLHLPDADPTLLGGIAHGWPAVPLVLLHNWPYARGAGWMASVHPNVYADFGLAVPFCSTRGMQATLSELLHVGPLSKVLYSSDASRIPELYWLGSRHARRVLGQVLEGCVRDGDLTASQAERAAADILRGNAARLYGIG